MHFRVWAPRVREIAVEIDGWAPDPAQRRGGRLLLGPGRRDARPGMRYGFRTDTLDRLLPDPASRFQPEGPHGPSEIVDPGTFRWTDQAWRGRPREEMVVYEMHVGSFTPEGSWEAASRELPELAALGITCIELMPVADFAGRFGWGYDGVDQFAPTRLYGRPDDFRRFVDRAHAHGIAVILDVVYNHFGPDGNYATCFSQSYFTDRYENEWGDPINFDGPEQRARCASSFSPMPAIGSTSITSTGCGSTRRSRSSTPRTTTSWPRSCGGCGRRRATGSPLSSARTSRGTPSWCGRRSAAATVSTRCGTTISTTARWSR